MDLLSFPSTAPNFSRVTILQNMQAGGVGLVFKAKHERSDAPVALKLIPLRTSSENLNFIKEATTSQILSDSGCSVPIIDSFIENNWGGIVMKLMDSDLFTVLSNDMDEQKLKQIFYKICFNIKQCHKRQIAHLDIKPENILMDSNGNVKLCDFGSALKFNEPVNKPIGTIFYGDHDIYSNKNFSKPAADIWSLGVLLHMMLLNRYPYLGKNETELVQNYRDNFISYKYIHDANITIKAKQLLLWLLQRDPKSRPTIQQVLNCPWFEDIQK